MRVFKKLLTSFFLITILVVGMPGIFAQDDGFGDESGGADIDSGSGLSGGDGDYDDPYAGGRGDPYGDGYGDSPAPTSAKELTTLEEIDLFLKEADDQPSVVGFFDASTNSADLENFQEVARSEGYTHRFAYVTQKEILEAKKYDGCAVLVYPAPKFINDKLERSKHRFPSKSLSKTNVLTDFIKAKSIPLAGEVTLKLKSMYNDLKKPIITLFSAVDHVRNAKGFQYLANRARKLAKKYEGKVYFNIANTDDFKYDMENDYGFTEPNGKNTVVGIREGDIFYKMESKFSFDNLATFVEEFLSGKLAGTGKERTTPSYDEPPTDEDDGDDSDSKVVAVNKENHDEIVNGSTDVMIEFYAPWCGHCKQLKPQYKKVADHFADDDSVTVAAFDATSSTIPTQYNVEGYPTLFFVPKGSKTPIPYEGDRSSQAIVNFINEKKTGGSSSEL